MSQRFVSLVGAFALFGYPARSADAPPAPTVVVRAEADSERAPHGHGNVYAPDILRFGNAYYMWFGGQGQDGHDRIHLTVSSDGLEWEQRGVVLEDPSANHCNDPSVVNANGVLFMFYTRAASGVTDEVAVATSTDGEHWRLRGTALAAGQPGAWNSLSVGRPSVLFSDGLFRMWYDGRKDLPSNAPDPKAPKSNRSQRHVGYATSRDGIHWERHGREPVYDHDAGGVHVLPIAGHLVMMIEGRAGTDAATSDDGIHWHRIGLLLPRAELPAERHGHVTPFLLADPDGAGARLFYGAAAEPSWDANTIFVQRLSDAQWRTLKSPEPGR
ncbi:MAG: exo-alpha-sialidase [Chthoniobacteraceae bacterium]